MARRSKRGRHSEQPPNSAAPTASDASFLAAKWAYLWLTVAVIVVFAASVPNGFVWLDHSEIEQANYRVVDSTDFSRIWHETIEQYQAHRSGVAVSQGGYWRPIYALAISLDWALWNGRAWCYHVENIAWHLAVVLLLYTFGNQVFGETETGRRAVFWATLLFAVHPFGVHSVTWISGRKDTMCAAFGIATLVAFGRAIGIAKRDEAARVAPWLVLSAVCLLLAIGSKELGFMVPIVAAVFFCPRFQLSDTTASNRPWSTWVAGAATLVACAAVLVVYRVAVVGAGGLGAQYPTDSVINNVATSTNLWWHYVLRILLPFQVTLSDAWAIVQSMGPLDTISVLGALALAGATIYGLLHRQSWALALTWFVIWMLPASGILTLRHFRAERYLYPASWGVLLAALLLLLPLATPVFASHARRATNIIVSLLVTWFAITTIRDSRYWSSDAKLFGHSVAQDPRHVEGLIELSHQAIEAQNYPEAVRLAQQALDSFADRNVAAYGVPFFAYDALGVALLQMGQPQAAIDAYERALKQLPNSPSAYAGIGMANFRAGNFPAAAQSLRRALEFSPSDNDTRNNLTLILIELGQFAEAEPEVERLCRERPDDVSNLSRLAWVQWKLDKREAALNTLQHAQTRAPNDPIVIRVAEMIRQEQTAVGGRP